MNDSTTLIYAIVLLAALGLVLALILYLVAQKFKVEEDPRIDQVADALPGANCGACGKAGCRDMAVQIVKDPAYTGCPVCNEENVARIAEILGRVPEKKDPMIAVLRCKGGKINTEGKVRFEGLPSCSYANSVLTTESGCPFGCIGFGDCTAVCAFDALHINPLTGLPETDPDKCTACGACTKACPRGILEIRKRRDEEGRVYVGCMNKQKGVYSAKVCKVSCIGCGKCVKTCPQNAITLENNLAYVNDALCISCQACVEACPTHAMTIMPLDKKKAPAAPEATAQTI
ncbi:MAG: RnfABCDGE type electron transport complex subunit B [Bacteroidales bacterium]|nr:RnfABCDGE type electron transport complex subunit B [Bacteroidales bacterium]MDE7073387.1 RnfABCDGE type electron transport complex subunit B [Bacteroidales bacterium]